MDRLPKPSPTCTPAPSPGPLLQGWSKFTASAFRCLRVEGNHLWPLDKEAKRGWLEVIAGELGELQF